MASFHFASFPQLLTERLVLRELLATDAAAIIVLRSNDIVNQYINRPKTITPAGALQFIEKINTYVRNGESCIGLLRPNTTITLLAQPVYGISIMKKIQQK
jgi:RimJ/RimL family protein N-acetyltransferase